MKILNKDAKILDYPQGSIPWKEARIQKITSTLVSKIIYSPTKAAIDQYQTGGDDISNLPHIERGTQSEYPIRQKVEELFFETYTPVTLIDGYRLASLDGLSVNGTEILEIKCPENTASETYQRASFGEVPKAHFLQMQFAMAVSGASKGLYVVCLADRNEYHEWIPDLRSILYIPVQFDPDTWDQIKIAEQRFFDHMAGLSEMTHNLPQGHEVLAKDYIEAKDKLKNLQAYVKGLEESLKAYGPHEGNGVCVKEMEGRKTFNKNQLIKDYNLSKEDIDKYTKTGEKFLQIAILKEKENV